MKWKIEGVMFKINPEADTMQEFIQNIIDLGYSPYNYIGLIKDNRLEVFKKVAIAKNEDEM